MPTPVDFPYTHARWADLLDQTVTSIRLLAEAKGGEYAGDTDRLANFRRNASVLGLLPEQVWAVYAGKHWDAIQQWIRDLSQGKERPRLESLAGRADDLIVYLILLKAMIEVREVPKAMEQALQATSMIPPLPPSLPKAVSDSERKCPHEWRKYDRHTDMCIHCNFMRPHGSNR